MGDNDAIVTEPAHATTYQNGKTYCYDEFDDTIRNAIQSFSQVDDLLTSYNGANYSGSGTTFTASICKDGEYTVARGFTHTRTHTHLFTIIPHIVSVGLT